MARALESESAYNTLELELEAAELEALAQLSEEPDDGADTESTSEEAAAEAVEALDAGDQPDGASPTTAATSMGWQELLEAGNADGLLERAAAYRAGNGVERDLEECYRSYQAAAELGSAEGMFAAALFKLSGAVVAEDVSAGMGQLRKAAGAGSLRAKMYLANMYELGIAREPDRDKADVWYRSAARAADVKDDPDDRAYTLALAELGSIRHARVLLTDSDVSKKDQVAFLAKAKTLGYGLHQRNHKRSAAEQEAIALEIEEAMQSQPSATAGTETAGKSEPGTEAERKAEQKEDPEPSEADPRRAKMAERATAFFIAFVFVAAAAAGGIAVTRYAYQLLAQGAAVPVVGPRVGLITPICVAIGLLPGLLVYQLRTVALAIVAALSLGAAGWVGWATASGQLFADRLLQSQAFGLTGLVVALLLLGLAGGTRQRRWKQS